MAIDRITTGAVLDGAIATADIADDAITGAKIENNPTIAGNAIVSGTLGVGETSPLGKFHVKSGDSAASAVNGNANELVVENSDFTGITILGENESNIMFGDNEDPDVGRIEYHHSDNSMRLRTAAADKVVIASSGLAQFKSTGISAGNQVLQVIDDGATLFQIRAEDGNISFPQAGGGIYLGVTSGAASNLLNDYEEGTWTPVMTGSSASPSSPTSGNGIYTKIGNQVIIFGTLNDINITGASGNARITGLPFPCQTGISGGQVPGSLYGNQFLISGLANAEYALVEATTGQSYLQLRLIRNNNTTAAVVPLTSGYFEDDQTDLRFQITYRTTA